MKITNTRVYGLEESVIASGYPMLTKTPDEKEFKENVKALYLTFDLLEQGFSLESAQELIPEYPVTAHITRACTLASSTIGSGHDTWLKGVIVQMDIKAPQYWWQQAQRYGHLNFVSSQSKMHKLKEMNVEDSVSEMVDMASIDAFELVKQDYNSGTIDFETLVANLPMGFVLTARMTTNFLQLKTILQQRENHKLNEWKEFCKWIRELHLFDLLTNRQGQQKKIFRTKKIVPTNS